MANNMKWPHEFLRYEYPLTSESLVFDVGGYKGEFTKNIIEKFNCSVHLFEPMNDYFKDIPLMPKVKMVNMALGDHTLGTCMFYKNNDASGMYESKPSGNLRIDNMEMVKMVDIYEYMMDEQIENVDLIKINIEGGEYSLLNRMIEKKIVQMFNFIQIQFHNIESFGLWDKNLCVKAREQITKELIKTHRCDWCFDWIWESWSRR